MGFSVWWKHPTPLGKKTIDFICISPFKIIEEALQPFIIVACHVNMRKEFIFCILVMLLLACKDEEIHIIQKDNLSKEDDNRFTYKIVSADSLSEGQFLGLGIGEEKEELYSKLQGLHLNYKLGYFAAIGLFNPDLSEISERILLYNRISLFEADRTKGGVSIIFSDNIVHSIYASSIEKLERWPENTEDSYSISTGDSIKFIYQKLLNIYSLEDYKKMFGDISLMDKNFSTKYDPEQMGIASKWYLTAMADKEDHFYEITLNFKDDKLETIYATLVEKINNKLSSSQE